MKFRPKPLTVDVGRCTGDQRNRDKLSKWVGRPLTWVGTPRNMIGNLDSADGIFKVRKGDYIVRYPDGRFRKLSPAELEIEFEKTEEP